jgi:spermidine synthase
MYHVIGTGLTTILLYIVSYSFYRIGYYSLQFHRKLWNSILAVAFFLTAFAGIFMALQINYKWNVPFVKSVLKWHVEFGIGLTITGMVHFIWHLSYFGKIFNKSNNFPEDFNRQKVTATEMSTNLFIIGLVSSSVQLLFIREVMNIAGGYELITGTFLGSWLIGSAVGASIADKSSLSDLRKINLIFSVSPVISILLLLLLTRLFLNTGETPSFLVSMVYTFLVLIPFCLVSGFTFVKLIKIARSCNDFVPGKSFSIETAGGITSGILITIFTAGILNTYQLFLLITLLSGAYVFLKYLKMSYRAKTIFKLFIAGLAAMIIIFNPDVIFRKILLPGINVIGSKDTPYGNITQGKYNGELSLYYNHRLEVYKDDVIEREENIHYAMLQSSSPDKVVLISGPLRSHLPEILKYPVKKIIYIERDPELARLTFSSKEILPKELTIENEDAFKYIKRSIEKADIIILLLPPPSTLLLNRYYTTEFFNEVKKNLNTGGVFMCSPGPGDNYMNQESLDLYSSIFNSLGKIFNNVKPVVGNKLYLIASDSELSVSFCKLTEIRSIKNAYVSSDYLTDDLLNKKSNEVKALMDTKTPQNRVAFPIGILHSQAYNLSKNSEEKTPAIVLMVLLFAVPIIRIKWKNLIMFFSASALAGFEIIILMTLQLTVGNMYEFTGLIIAGLMTGLSVGSGMKIKILSQFTFKIRIITLSGLYICFGLLYNYILTIENGIIAISILVFSAFLPALYTGNIFRDLTLKSDGRSESSEVYSADLIGSACGFILVSVFAIPLIGVQFSILLLSLLVFVGLIFGTVVNK